MKKKNLFELCKKMNLNVMRPKNFHTTLFKNLKRINNNVSKNSGWGSVKKCPICESKSYFNWMEKCGNSIKKCNICSHGFSNRYAKNMSEVYDSHIENEIKAAGSKSVYKKKIDYKLNTFAIERVNLLRKFKKNGKLLDYGCGNGWFLRYAKKYYKSHGYEPTKNLAKLSSDTLKIRVERDISKYKNSSFDIITSFDVIEHVPKPKETFQEYFRLLKKNGILLIFTPNADSVAFDYMKENQNLVSPPIHLHYFNKKSINFLGKKNFSLIYFRTAGLDVGDIYAYERDLGDKKFSKFLFKNYKSIQTFYDNIGFGNHLRAIFKKK